MRHGLRSAQMQPLTPGIDDSFPTAIWQAKVRWRQGSGTPQGYTTNSGQHEQLSHSANTTMSEGTVGKTSPVLPPHSWLWDS